MNKGAHAVRVKVTNEMINHLVGKGYEFFSAVFLHSDYNEVGVRHLVKDKLELWSDSMFFSVPGKAAILRVSLNYQGAVPGAAIGANRRDRMILSFRFLAAAKPLQWLNQIAQEQHVALRTIPMDDHAFDHFSQPMIPVFVVEDSPQDFNVRERMNWFMDTDDKWVTSVAGAQPAVSVSDFDSQIIKSLSAWLAPALPYVKDGMLDIPERSGITKDPNFLRSEAAVRERLNLRNLREIATFGKFL
jgi:hypothetical protein